MSGPAPKPTALKVLEGNRGHQKLNRAEPKPQGGVPTRPEWLLPEAKREWMRVVPQLETTGVLALIDRAVLSAYCQAFGRAVKYERFLEKYGDTFTSGNGYVQQRPEVAMLKDAWERVAKFGAKLGLSPADRSRISMPEKKDDSLDAILGRASASS